MLRRQANMRSLLETMSSYVADAWEQQYVVDFSSLWETYFELVRTMRRTRKQERCLKQALRRIKTTAPHQEPILTSSEELKLMQEGRLSTLVDKIRGMIAYKLLRRPLTCSHVSDIRTARGNTLAIVKVASPEEILICQELDSLCEEKKLAFVPCYYTHLSDLLYMEYIEGRTLSRAIRGGLNGDLLNKTLGVVHALLDWLWSSVGFVHCDLHADNIMLRGYKSGKTYEVPLVDSSGSVTKTYTLPFYPMLIDFGNSVTEQHSSWEIAASPIATPCLDVLRLYCALSYDLSSLVDSIKKKIDKKLYKSDPRTFFPPLELSIEGLSHRELAELYLEP